MSEIPTEATEKKLKNEGKGCLTCGCITVIAIIVLIAAFAIYGVVNLRQLTKEYTEDTAYTQSVETLTLDEYRQFENEFDKNLRSLRAGKEATFNLTEAQINAILKYHKDFSISKDIASVKIENNIIKVVISYTDSFILDNKFLNFIITIESADNSLKITDFSFPGKQDNPEERKSLSDALERTIYKSLSERSLSLSQFEIVDNTLSFTISPANSSSEQNKSESDGHTAG